MYHHSMVSSVGPTPPAKGGGAFAPIMVHTTISIYTISTYIYIYIYIYTYTHYKYIYIYMYIHLSNVSSFDVIVVWGRPTSKREESPRIPQRRLQSQEETPRKQGDTMCTIVFDGYHRPVFSESLLGFGIYSGEFRDP